MALMSGQIKNLSREIKTIKKKKNEIDILELKSTADWRHEKSH